jgi:hypothetical protein
MQWRAVEDAAMSFRVQYEYKLEVPVSEKKVPRKMFGQK